ncbi:hypothetical protein GH714_025271 [Hevea brasiliensis]|uniref:Anaphase-promoting complex subunit 4 WD40 domain-containing protein n=1 Tax=Hevea brasiliensis TaxID=3981 RepID=A0A6A6LAQ6_HEVBR|nr:hypothetical protein GH714_025271 [Hevea brasiliensis]
MLEARSLSKAVVSSTLIENPSPGNLQPTRLALHVNEDASSCWVYMASGCHLYKLQVPMQDSSVNKGKESLLIPLQTQVMDSSVVNRCPHRSEIQSIVLCETESVGNLVLGSVDSYGHLIVSKLDSSGKDIDSLTYSVSPRDSGVGEGSWAGLCFSPSQWSMAAVAHSFCKSIDVYDQDIHLRTLRTLWYPSSLNFLQNLNHGDGSSILAVTEGCQLTIWDLRMKENGGCLHRICGSLGDIFYAVCSSSTGNIAVGGADRTVTIYDPRRFFVANGKRAIKYFRLEETQTGLGSVRRVRHLTCLHVNSLLQCSNSNRDLLGGWCDSGSVFLADVGANGS